MLILFLMSAALLQVLNLENSLEKQSLCLFLNSDHCYK